MADESIKAADVTAAFEFYQSEMPDGSCYRPTTGQEPPISFLMAVYARKVADEQTADLRERLAAFIKADQHIAERITWILEACEIDRDAKNELEGILSGVQE